MKQQLFNIGDVVYSVYAAHSAKKVPCFVCNGQKFITIIDGFGVEVKPQCTYCNEGLGTPPSGFSTEYEYQAIVRSIIIDSVRKNSDGEFEYNYSGEVYKTREEAELAGQKLVEANKKDEERRLKFKKEDANKSWSWHVGYHRQNIKKAERDLEHHSEKLGLAKSKVKEEKAK